MPMSRERRGDLLGPVGSSYGLPRRVPSSVPPFGSMPAQRTHVERHRAALAHAVPGVEEPDELVAVVPSSLGKTSGSSTGQLTNY